MNLNIIAIGGGEIRDLETMPLDQLAVEATGKPRPSALFVPTASGDSAAYCDTFRRVYGERLGCQVDELLLSRGPSEVDAAGGKIEAADLIYVGGGNTRAMLDRWRATGVDRWLGAAGRAGKVLIGLSAGAICWCRAGNSDAPMLDGEAGKKTVRVEGLGLVPLSLCPHIKREPFRRDEFREMLREGRDDVGLGLDDLCAIQIRGDEYRIVAAGPEARAHLFRWEGGALVERRLEPDARFRPIGPLLHGDPARWPNVKEGHEP